MTQLSEAALRDVVDRLDIGVFVLNRELEVLFWNNFMAASSGMPAIEIVGRRLTERFPELPERWLRKKVETVFVLRNRSFTVWEQRPYLLRFHHNRPVTGGVEYMYQNCTFSPCRNAEGGVETVVVTLQDVTDLAMAHRALELAKEQLAQSSRLDGLTGLFNRGYWEHCLAGEFKRSLRSGAPLALIIFDLDHFKVVNDSFGHLAGDEILRGVGERLRAILRETDIAGRYGGEEFGVIATDCEVAGACALAERIRSGMEALSFAHEGQAIRVTVSLGISGNDPAVNDYQKLIAQADAALYRSKREGRNRFSAYHAG